MLTLYLNLSGEGEALSVIVTLRSIFGTVLSDDLVKILSRLSFSGPLETMLLCFLSSVLLRLIILVPADPLFDSSIGRLVS